MNELRLVVVKLDTIEVAIDNDVELWGWTGGEWDYEKLGLPSEVWSKSHKNGFNTGIPGALATSEHAAEYIVKACNLFPELVALADAVSNGNFNQSEIIDKARALLTKAKEN